jgi:hypothetical protein
VNFAKGKIHRSLFFTSPSFRRTIFSGKYKPPGGIMDTAIKENFIVESLERREFLFKDFVKRQWALKLTSISRKEPPEAHQAGFDFREEMLASSKEPCFDLPYEKAFAILREVVLYNQMFIDATGIKKQKE